MANVDFDQFIPKESEDGIDRIQTKMDNLVKTTIQLSGVIRGMPSFDGSSLSGAGKRAADNKKSYDELGISIREYTKLLNQKAIEQAKVDLLDSQEYKNLLKLREERKAGAAAIKAEGDAYRSLVLNYQKAEANLRSLLVTHSRESKEVVAASAQLRSYGHQIDYVNNELKDYAAQTKRGLGISYEFSQILRELPAFTFNWQTGLLGVSNNIPIFLDRLKQMRQEGLSSKEIYGQLGTSLLSFNNIITLGVAALAIFGNEIFDTGEEAEDAETKIDGLADSISALIAKETQLRRNRGAARGNDNVATAEQELEIMQAQGASAALILAQQEKITKLRVRDIEVEKQSYQALNDHVRQAFDFYNSQGNSEETTRERLGQDKDIIKSLMEVTGVTQEEAAKQTKVIAESYNTRQSVVKTFNDKINELDIKAAAENNKLRAEQIKVAKAADEKARKEREKALEEYHRKAEKNYKAQFESQATALEISIDRNKKIAEDENASADDRIIALTQYFQQKSKLIEETAEFEKVEGNKTLDEQKAIDDAKVKSLEALADETIKINYDIVEDDIKKNEKIKENLRSMTEFARKQALDRMRLEQEVASHKRKVNQEAVLAVIELGNISVEKDNKVLDAKQKNIDQQKEQELAYIESLNISEEERRDRRYRAEQQAFLQQKALDKQKEDLEKRRFVLEQAAALARILFSTQENVAKLQGQAAVLASNPLTASFASLPLSQIPLVYASGAIAAGIIGAQVLAYKEGTPLSGHPGGDALIGEGKNSKGQFLPEYLKEPGKPGKWVFGPTYFEDLAAGSHVIPLHKMSDDMLAPSVYNMRSNQYGDLMALRNASKMDADRIVSAIKNQPKTETVYRSGWMYQTITTGNTRMNKLRKRIL